MSTTINVIVGGLPLLEDLKVRVAANQQALDDRFAEEKTQQTALTETSSELEPETGVSAQNKEQERSGLPSVLIPRRPAAQRRRRLREEEEEETDEDGNLIIRYIGLYNPIRSDNVRAQTVTWPTVYVEEGGNTTTEVVYRGGTNSYRIEDTVIRPTFDFWRGGAIVANSVSAPPVYALNNVISLSWIFRRVGFYFPSGVVAGPTYVSAPVGTFPFNFSELQNLQSIGVTREVFTLASSTVEHVYYSYAYIERRAPKSIIDEINTILSVPDQEAGIYNDRVFIPFNSIFDPKNTRCGYVKLNKRTGTIEFRQSTFTGVALGSFVDNLYKDDPHYDVALRSSFNKDQYPLSRTEKWPSSLQYNPETGVAVIVARAANDNDALREVYTKGFSKNLAYSTIFERLLVYAPYSPEKLQEGGFVSIGTVNRYEPFGELYTELFPLIFR
jgi:hypothetical protein